MSTYAETGVCGGAELATVENGEPLFDEAVINTLKQFERFRMLIGIGYVLFPSHTFRGIS